MMPPCAPGQFPKCASATMDHLTPKGTSGGKMRPARAAHAFCNSARHHDPGISEKNLAKARWLFETLIAPKIIEV